jgi:hypothetical protein
MIGCTEQGGRFTATFRMRGLLLALFCTMLFQLSATVPNIYGESVVTSRSPQEILTLGERLYRDGILPSGEVMSAFVKGDLPVPGTAFSCVSCHMRGGLGSVEGGVFTPPTNGALLYQPFRILFKGLEQKYFPFPDRRPAYTDESLAEAIRSGQSPAGIMLNDVMPRYLLEDEDMAILITYLKALSSQYSPGVSGSTLHFATIITEDVSPEDRAAMLAPLQQYVTIKNGQAGAYQKPLGKKSRLMAENMLISKELSTRTISLSLWTLKGSPDTWRNQLEDFYRKEPVFALLGGITSGEWREIHRFSEENKIPCLFPQTDLPVVSSTDWYTLYPSKGYFQEGEAAARYLNSRADIPPERPIIQLVRNSVEGRALEAGFEQTLQELERRAPVTVRLNAGEKVTKKQIKQLTSGKPAIIVLWDGSDVPATLELLSAVPNRPEMVFVSSRYLGKNIQVIPEASRDFTFITYPFSFAQSVLRSSMGSITVEDDSKWRVALKDMPLRDKAVIASNLSGSITQLVTMALMDMRGNYYRDNFLDVIGMVPDQPSQTFARLSFGPGQRYASKGCYIVQLTSGSNPEMVRKSSWVIH